MNIFLKAKVGISGFSVAFFFSFAPITNGGTKEITFTLAPDFSQFSREKSLITTIFRKKSPKKEPPEASAQNTIPGKFLRITGRLIVSEEEKTTLVISVF